MSIYPQILGIYSRKTESQIGLGTTQDHHHSKTYWYAVRKGDNQFCVQPLNARHVPSRPKTTLNKADFLMVFEPEPNYYEHHTAPALRSLAAKIQDGKENYKLGNLDAAERAFLKALLIDEDNVEANFGLGHIYIDKKQYKKLENALRHLLHMDETFDEECRQSFNTFGIALRKNGLHKEALRYYQRALEFNLFDENLHFNIARVFFELKNKEKCLDHVQKALTLAPDLVPAQKLLKYVHKYGVERESVSS